MAKVLDLRQRETKSPQSLPHHHQGSHRRYDSEIPNILDMSNIKTKFRRDPDNYELRAVA